MKRMKKISAALLAGAMALSCAAVTAQAPSDEHTKELAELKIMVGDENDNMNFDQSTNRAEIIKMLCVAGKIDTAQHTESFPDVTEEHWAYDFICAAKDKGIVSGDENGLFNPEKAVTGEEAIKMIVGLLGYTPRAEAVGGYPIGYMATASQLGLTRDLALVSNSAISRGDLGEIFWRALDIPLMKAENLGNDDEAYVIADGKGDIPLETLRTNLTKK